MEAVGRLPAQVIRSPCHSFDASRFGIYLDALASSPQLLPGELPFPDTATAALPPPPPCLGPVMAPARKDMPDFQLPPPAYDAALPIHASQWLGKAFAGEEEGSAADPLGEMALKPGKPAMDLPMAPTLRPASEPVELWEMPDFQLPTALSGEAAYVPIASFLAAMLAEKSKPWWAMMALHVF